MNSEEKATDEELASQAQAGSLDSFERLVFRYEARVYAFAAQYSPDRRDAREIAQDTFVKAFHAIAQFNPRCAPFTSWLFAIARRKCIDRHRANGRMPASELVPEIVDFRTPDETLATSEERAALWTLARKQLPRLQYEALWLRYAEEMEVVQIAHVLGKTRVHIKVLLFRARQTLSTLLRHPAASGFRRPSVLPAQDTNPAPGRLFSAVGAKE